MTKKLKRFLITLIKAVVIVVGYFTMLYGIRTFLAILPTHIVKYGAWAAVVVMLVVVFLGLVRMHEVDE